MKVIIDIADKDATFVLKVLNSLTFVKNANKLSPSNAKLYNDFLEASDQVRKHKQGKIKLKTAQELINEL
jgi:hypothetical protein